MNEIFLKSPTYLGYVSTLDKDNNLNPKANRLKANINIL